VWRGTVGYQAMQGHSIQILGVRLEAFRRVDRKPTRSCPFESSPTSLVQRICRNLVLTSESSRVQFLVREPSISELFCDISIL